MLQLLTTQTILKTIIIMAHWGQCPHNEAAQCWHDVDTTNVLKYCERFHCVMPQNDKTKVLEVGHTLY